MGGLDAVLDTSRGLGVAKRRAGSLVSSWVAHDTSITSDNESADAGALPAITNAATFNRAIETYLAYAPMVSWFRLWAAATDATSPAPPRLVTWEDRMDAPTLCLSGSCETVYGLAAIDLNGGAVAIDAPPGLLARITDLRQQDVLAIGPTGADSGRGGTVLLLPPDYVGPVPTGCIVGTPVTYGVVLRVRGFLVDGQPSNAVDLMKRIRIFRLGPSSPIETTFVDGSRLQFDAGWSDGYEFFEDLAHLIARESSNLLAPHDRAALAALGIEKGRPFRPDAGRRGLLAEAGRFGSSIARINGHASDASSCSAYPDRRWEWLSIGWQATWNAGGDVDAERCAAFWTPRDASGAFLDGGRHYRLRLPANIPAQTLWSVSVDDGADTSILAEPRPVAGRGPDVNADGSVDVHFGPHAPYGRSRNWIHTIDGRGWFAVVRFHGPLPALFDGSWRPSDLEPRGISSSLPA